MAAVTIHGDFGAQENKVCDSSVTKTSSVWRGCCSWSSLGFRQTGAGIADPEDADNRIYSFSRITKKAEHICDAHLAVFWCVFCPHLITEVTDPQAQGPRGPTSKPPF